jgi:hypothetical protein
MFSAIIYTRSPLQNVFEKKIVAGQHSALYVAYHLLLHPRTVREDLHHGSLTAGVSSDHHILHPMTGNKSTL